MVIFSKGFDYYMCKIIGISGRTIKVDGKEIVKVPKNIIKYIKKYKATPIIIPDAINKKDLELLLPIFSGFIIPGGVTFSKLDESIIDYAINKDIPLLGICAGMQAIANYNNFKTSNSDQTIKIESDINHFEEDKDYAHYININDGLLYSIINRRRIKVNSRHNYKVKNADFFYIDAACDDGVIEAIHIPNKTCILGLEWHPEDLVDQNSKKIFAFFISKCINK